MISAIIKLSILLFYLVEKVMRKKILLTLIMAFAFSITAFTLTACGNACNHSFTNYISNNDATFESDGTKTAVCDNGCGKTDTIADVGSKLTATSASAFTFDNGTITGLTDYGKSLTKIVIPKTINDIAVTNIGDNAFYSCISLTSIEIPNSVTSIGYRAFYNCYSLNKVNYLGTIDTWVQIEFGYEANPLHYAKNLYINNELVTNANITTATKISSYAFENCNSLQSVIIGNSVTCIKYNAFSGCGSLTSIIIPNSVTSIDENAFSGCTALTIYCEAESKPSGFEIGWNNPQCPIVWNCLNNDATNTGSIYTVIDGIRYTLADGVAIVATQAKNITTANIPESIIYKDTYYSVTHISRYAFYNCTSLTSVTIGNSVTNILYNSFDGCTSLQSVIIGNSVKSIGGYAFYNCDSLNKVNYLGTIDSWVQIEFGYYTANPLHYAENLYINNELVTNANITTATKISSYAFENCNSLQSVTIGNSVTDIGQRAFYSCSSFISIIIPNRVTSIGGDAFMDCRLLTIYCEAESKPSGWNTNWNNLNRPVVWGYKPE
ncbi:MAG: leucine-rich repeat domain-containing protein [Clostridia bacterium]|nr:leucine-rich repeat domain-containing protein [Clostridia bacterium]